MLIPSLRAILDRELRSLRREVEAYENDAQLWQAVAGLPNSGGTLTLHLAGNLQHYIGACLGRTGYVRDRAAEFSRRDLPAAQLLAEVTRCHEAVTRTLDTLPESALEEDFSEPVGGVRLRTDEFLVHLVGHFGYHLGQLDSHRRIVTGKTGSIGPLPLTDLGSARKVVGGA